MFHVGPNCSKVFHEFNVKTRPIKFRYNKKRLRNLATLKEKAVCIKTFFKQ